MEFGRGSEKSQRSWIRRYWTVVEIFSVILTAVFMLVVVTSLLRNTECEVKSSSSSTKRLESICNVTLYSDQCYSTLMSVNSTEPRVLLRASLVINVEEHVKILGFLSKLVSSDKSVKSSLKVCDEMIVDALECLKETIERFDEFGKVMMFVNTAGSRKGQAVAFHSDARHSVMYRCAFEGYQDTLYARDGRQFYRDYDIVGTVDFIFGHAAAVFQPLPNQFNTITAQTSNETNIIISDFSIVNSKIYPYKEDLTAETYLGRPWSAYSTVVVMKTQIEKLIDPKGWVPWNNKSSPPTTITYGEYMNYGPGLGVSNRVKWTGYKPKMTYQEAHKYTVDALINHNGWLRHTCVPSDITVLCDRFLLLIQL